MAYEIEKAKKLVIEAGKKLVEKGLIARTWGNVSARISDTQFVITPSGRSYEELTADELVVVNIDDCSYEGKIKPSTEKGIHADVYKHRKNVDFVIHTHQKNATIVSVTGLKIKNVYDEFKAVLGDEIAVAEYGMSTSPALRKNVEKAVLFNPKCKAFLLMNHGALCLGESYDEAFEVAEKLEECSKKVLIDNYLRTSKNKYYSYDDKLKFYLNKNNLPDMPEMIGDFGSSVRMGHIFTLTYADGKKLDVDINTGLGINGKAPTCASLHRAIYQAKNFTMIKHIIAKPVVAVSCSGKSMYPMIDDFAQIVGVNVKNRPWRNEELEESARGIGNAIIGRNAVMIEGNGAIIAGNNERDLEALEMILTKSCEAVIDCEIFNRVHFVPITECMIMRAKYTMSYSKLINK